MTGLETSDEEAHVLPLDEAVGFAALLLLHLEKYFDRS